MQWSSNDRLTPVFFIFQLEVSMENSEHTVDAKSIKNSET